MSDKNPITAEALKGIQERRDTREQEKLDTEGLAAGANKLIDDHQEKLKELPEPMRESINDSLLKYLLTSVERYDADKNSAINKAEFEKYKADMLVRLDSIIGQYAPTQEQLAAREKQKDALAQAKEAAEKAEDTEVKDANFNEENLKTPDGVKQELLKFGKQHQDIQKEAAGVSENIATFHKAVAAFEEGKKEWRSMLRGFSTNDEETQEIKNQLSQIRRVTYNKTAELQAKKQAIAAYGEKLNQVTDTMRREKTTEREAKLTLLANQGVSLDSAEKKNAAQYELLQAKQNQLAKRHTDLLEYKKSLASQQEAQKTTTEHLTITHEQLAGFQEKMVAAVADIDEALSNKNLSKEAREKLEEQKKEILEKTETTEIGIQETESAGQETRSALQILDEQQRNADAQTTRVQEHLTGTVEPSLKSLSASLKTLQEEKLKNGTAREQVDAAYVGVFESLDAIDTEVAENVLKNTLATEQQLGSLELQKQELDKVNLEDPSVLESTVGVVLSKSATGLTYISDGIDYGTSWLKKSTENIPIISQAISLVSAPLDLVSGALAGFSELENGIGMMISHPTEVAKGMGALFGRDPRTGEMSWATAGNTWKEMAKAMIATKEFEEGKWGKGVGKAAFNLLMTTTGLEAGTAAVKTTSLVFKATRVAGSGALNLAKATVKAGFTGTVAAVQELGASLNKLPGELAGFAKSTIDLPGKTVSFFKNLGNSPASKIAVELAATEEKIAVATEGLSEIKIKGNPLSKMEGIAGKTHTELQNLSGPELAQLGITDATSARAFIKYKNGVKALENLENTATSARLAERRLAYEAEQTQIKTISDQIEARLQPLQEKASSLRLKLNADPANVELQRDYALASAELRLAEQEGKVTMLKLKPSSGVNSYEEEVALLYSAEKNLLETRAKYGVTSETGPAVPSDKERAVGDWMEHCQEKVREATLKRTQIKDGIIDGDLDAATRDLQLAVQSLDSAIDRYAYVRGLREAATDDAAYQAGIETGKIPGNLEEAEALAQKAHREVEVDAATDFTPRYGDTAAEQAADAAELSAKKSPDVTKSSEALAAAKAEVAEITADISARPADAPLLGKRLKTAKAKVRNAEAKLTTAKIRAGGELADEVKAASEAEKVAAVEKAAAVKSKVEAHIAENPDGIALDAARKDLKAAKGKLKNAEKSGVRDDIRAAAKELQTAKDQVGALEKKLKGTQYGDALTALESELKVAEARVTVAKIKTGEIKGFETYKGFRGIAKDAQLTMDEANTLLIHFLENSGAKIEDLVRVEDTLGPLNKIKIEGSLDEVAGAARGVEEVIAKLDGAKSMSDLEELVATVENAAERDMLNKLAHEIHNMPTTVIEDFEKATLFKETMRYLKDYKDALKNGGLGSVDSAQEVFDLLQSNQRKLAHQVIVDRSYFTGSDHGVTHLLEGNMAMADKIMADLGDKITPQERVMVRQALIDHDMGYTMNAIERTNDLNIFRDMTGDHPIYSTVFVEANKADYVKYFGEQGYETIRNAILDHSSAKKVDFALRGQALVESIVSAVDCLGVTADVKMMKLFRQPEMMAGMLQLQELATQMKPLAEAGEDISSLTAKSRKVYETMMNFVRQSDFDGVLKEKYLKALETNFDPLEPTFAFQRDFGSHSAGLEGISLGADGRLTVHLSVNENFGIIRDLAGKIGDAVSTNAFGKALGDFGTDLPNIKDLPSDPAKLAKMPVTKVLRDGVATEVVYTREAFAADVAKVESGEIAQLTVESPRARFNIDKNTTKGAEMANVLRRERAMAEALRTLDKSPEEASRSLAKLHESDWDGYILDDRTGHEVLEEIGMLIGEERTSEAVSLLEDLRLRGTRPAINPTNN